MNAGQYESKPPSLVIFLQKPFMWLSPCRYPPRHGGGQEPRWAASRPSVMATHRVKPSRPADGV